MGATVRRRRHVSRRPAGARRLRPDAGAACGRTSASRRPRSRRMAVTCSSAWRAPSCRTARRRRWPAGARRASCATTSRPGASIGSTSMSPTRSPKRPCPPTAFAVNGLVELLPFNTQFMLAMERSFSVGAHGDGEHDQALLGRRAAGRQRERAAEHRRARVRPVDEDAAARPATRSASRSTTSKAWCSGLTCPTAAAR